MKQREPSELVELLIKGATELRAMFSACADKRTGKMPLQQIQREVMEIAKSWGFEPSSVVVVLLSERLLGAGGKVVDDSGMLHISYQEFMQFLETEDPLIRVMYAVKHHRSEVKRAFMLLLDKINAERSKDSSSTEHLTGLPGEPTAGSAEPAADEQEVQEAAVVATDKEASPSSSESALSSAVPLSALKKVLIDMAMRAGSGWGVSIGDLSQSLQPYVFLDMKSAGGDYKQLLTDQMNDEDINLSWPRFYCSAMSVINR